MFYQCPYCHKTVLKWFMTSHEAKHTRLRPDGQQAEHVTLPQTERKDGLLEEVPRVYRHRACGVCTQMPEEIIRSYLVDPLLYGDSSFCGGCGTYVPGGELEWTETGELLSDYSARLRKEYLSGTMGIQLPPDSTGGIVVTPAVAKAISEVARKHNVGPKYYLAVRFERQGAELKYKADLALGCDPKAEAVVVSGGMYVIVPKAQEAHFRGVVVDYRTVGGNGFVMRRYRPESFKG